MFDVVRRRTVDTGKMQYDIRLGQGACKNVAVGECGSVKSNDGKGLPLVSKSCGAITCMESRSCMPPQKSTGSGDNDLHKRAAGQASNSARNSGSASNRFLIPVESSRLVLWE